MDVIGKELELVGSLKKKTSTFGDGFFGKQTKKKGCISECSGKLGLMGLICQFFLMLKKSFLSHTQIILDTFFLFLGIHNSDGGDIGNFSNGTA